MKTQALNNRVVVITGANGGLGRALCAALHRQGARLAVLDLEAPVALAASLSGGDPQRAAAWAADVRDMDALQAVMDAVAGHFGGIDVVIANAGITAFEPLSCADAATFERVVDINLNGVWRTFKAGLPHVRNSGGYLLAVSSLAAFSHSPLQASYTASKAGVWALCNSIRLELRHWGVAVGSLHPTFFPTPMMEQTFADPAGKRLWGGNRGGLFKMVPLQTVVDAAVRGIVRRQEIIVVPRQNYLLGLAPGLLRKLIEKLGFNDRQIAATIQAAEQKAAAGDSSVSGG